MSQVKIQSALISVFYKDNLAPIIELLKANGVTIYSTGGTQKFIEEQGAEVVPVEDLTSYPSIFGGRVKPFTLKFLVEFCTDATMMVTLVRPRNSKFLQSTW